MLVCRRVVKQEQVDLELSPQTSGEKPEFLSTGGPAAGGPAAGGPAAGGPAAGGPAAGGPVFFPRRDPSPLAERLLAELSREGEGDSSVAL